MDASYDSDIGKHKSVGKKGNVDKGHCVDASSYGGEIGKGKSASKHVVNVYQGKSKDIEGDESKNNVGCVWW